MDRQFKLKNDKNMTVKLYAESIESIRVKPPQGHHKDVQLGVRTCSGDYHLFNSADAKELITAEELEDECQAAKNSVAGGGY